uniref:Uncharacterized protein n=1 Tax=Phlebotomus papatasi TaxID=29031 RepID=A0A1B0DGP5_PHLPP
RNAALAGDDTNGPWPAKRRRNSLAVSEGIVADNPHLVLLFYLSQLFLRELIKSYRLVQVIPMDMSGYYETCSSPATSSEQESEEKKD